MDIAGALDYIDVTEDQLFEALYAKMSELNNQLAEKIRQNLSGDVLNQKSGALYGTVVERGPYAVDDALETVVEAGGDAAPYGIVHEKGGEKEYLIQAINARALAFEVNGKMVFARSVIHPPLPARPWFGPATEEMEPVIAEELQKTMNEVMS